MLIINAVIIDSKTQKNGCLRIANGKIEQIAAQIKPRKNEEVIDAEGFWLLPGAVDINTGLGDATTANLKKLQEDALKGGVTTIALMPDVAVNSEVGFDYFDSKAKDIGLVSVKIAASTTENNAKEKLNNLSLVLNEGAIGVHSPSDLSPDYLRCAAKYVSMRNSTWFIRPQNKILDTNAQINDGKVAFSLGLSGFSRLSESSEVAKICEYAKDAKAKLVIEAISSKETVKIAANAKKEYDEIYLQATLAHLLLDENACLDFNSYAKIYPPLREVSDKNALLQACKNGLINSVASAHRPISSSKKEVAFDEAIFGIESISHFWTLAFTALYKELSIKKICALVASNPAKILGLQDRGLIAKNMRADLVLFDPNYVHQANNGIKNPLLRLPLNGKVVRVFSSGV